MSRLHDTIRPVHYARTSLLLGLLGACSHTTDFSVEIDAGAADSGLDAQVEEEAGAVDASFAQNEAGQAECAPGRLCECSNGVDDDKDGLSDGFDNECTGPFDDDETTFKVNDVREGNKRCTDCFFDGNPGPGDDRCDVATACSFEGRPGNGGGSCKTCGATTECVDRCTPITPNGCDCFGCCEVIYRAVPTPVRLVSTCRMDRMDDTQACPRCIVNQSCRNPCDACELCPGRTLADLPMMCMNAVECGERKRCSSPRDCDFSEYCSQGCCVPILL